MKQGLKTITIFLLLISIAGILSWYSIRQMNRVFKPIRVGVSAGPQAEILVSCTK
jgi:D-methionine transport system substrate-binding protein